MGVLKSVFRQWCLEALPCLGQCSSAVLCWSPLCTFPRARSKGQLMAALLGRGEVSRRVR